MIDVGTGDGRFVYHSARANPRRFFIGIDANRKPLQKISEKIYRRPAKGGLPNALFVQSAVETLPAELNGIASELHVNFPWGSLLQAVAGGNADTLGNLRRISSSGALLTAIVGFDRERDRVELERLQVPDLTLDYIETTLASRYRDAGFEIIERKILTASDWWKLETSWAKRLRGNSNRSVIRILARAK